MSQLAKRRALRALRRRIAVGNQKGGVGKTAIVLLLAATAARHGLRVLVADFDPQANVTNALLGTEYGVEDGMVAVMNGKVGKVRPSLWPGVDVLGSSLNLAKAEMDGTVEVPYRANQGLDELDQSYDLVLFDMPPSLGRLLAAGLIAADALQLVTEAAVDSLRGIVNVLASYETVQANQMNRRGLELLGIVVNNYRHTSEQDYRVDELRTTYGDLVFSVRIPQRTAFSEAHGANLSAFDHTKPGAREVAAAGVSLWEALSQRAGIPTGTFTSATTGATAAGGATSSEETR
jgi:chromosome partitioning protein